METRHNQTCANGRCCTISIKGLTAANRDIVLGEVIFVWRMACLSLVCLGMGFCFALTSEKVPVELVPVIQGSMLGCRIVGISFLEFRVF